MPFDPQGNYTLPGGSIVTTGENIVPSQHNPPLQDIASALSQALLRDGRAPMVGPLNMNGNRITGVPAGSTSDSLATIGQLIPIGAVIDYAGGTAPSGWLLCYGQAVSRATYAALFAAIDTTFGAGDGSTTFNLPDCRGRLVAGRDTMGGAAANRLTGGAPGVDGATLGASGGAQSQGLALANLPTALLSVNIPAGQGYHIHGVSGGIFGSTFSGLYSLHDTSAMAGSQRIIIDGSTLPAMSGTAALNGSGQAHNNVQPTIIMNKIIRASYNG